MTGNLSFGDNDKAIFGAGSDLQIYHSGSNNYVDAAGVGHLYLQSQGDDKDVKIRSDDGSGGLTEYFRADGSVGKAQMFYYGTKTLETTSTGVNVTGTLTSDGLTVTGSGSFSTSIAVGQTSFSGGSVVADFHTSGSGVGTQLAFANDHNTDKFFVGLEGNTTGNAFLYQQKDADINFYTNNSLKATLDNNGNFGIGTGSPASDAQLSISAPEAPHIYFERSNSGRYDSAIGMPSSGAIAFYNGANSATVSGLSERMRILSSGNVGIGEQDPDSTLQLSNSSSVPSFTLGRTPYSSHGNLTIGGTGTGHITSNIDEAGDSTVNVRASRVAVGNGEIDFQNSPQTAVGSARTFTTRLKVDEYGGLTIASVNATAAIFGGTNVVNGITAVPSPAGTPFVLGRDTGTTRSAHFGGNLKFDSGYGIDFSSTGNGTGTVSSELLDDYEEGTWTPVVYDTNTSGHVLTLNSIIGKYKKIGSWVNCTLQVGRNDATSLSGVIAITNLPFTVAAQGSATGGTFWLDNASSDRIGVVYVVPSADRFYLLSDHAVNNYLLMSEWQNSRPIYLQVSYNST
jgi:hypothetical protein